MRESRPDRVPRGADGGSASAAQGAVRVNPAYLREPGHPPLPVAPSPVPGRLRRGRGAGANPSGRYDREARVAADENWDFADSGWPADGEGGEYGEDSLPPLRTTVTRDAARSVIARNASPDIGFDQSINPYRGCEHGCVYCYARPSHEYLGLSAGLDFETRLFAKPEAAELLRHELSSPKYACKVIALGTNTDPYQPVERRLGITRSILEVLDACDHPVGIVTKSAGVVRDVDILARMAKRNLAAVNLSVTTLDRKLARAMEPRAASPGKRLEAMRTLADAGVPVGAMVAPVIPGLNDSEMEAILEACAAAGATRASKVVVRLPHGVKDLFKAWLAEHVPARAGHVMTLIREVRGGRENDPRFGTRHTGTGAYAEMLDGRFRAACRRMGLNGDKVVLDTTRFRPPAGRQLNLL